MIDSAGELISRTLRLLDEVPQWELAPARWDQVARLLEAVAGAADGTDDEGLLQAVARLELAGPPRITRIGAAPTQPAPLPVRERINRLVHRLTALRERRR